MCEGCVCERDVCVRDGVIIYSLKCISMDSGADGTR